jgi:formate--tetrahydrofolate ligase
MLDIKDIAEKINVTKYRLYGDDKAKVPHNLVQDLPDRKGKLILVTAITPTKAGEGKTTTTISLGQAFDIMGKKTIIALREPSLGPVFGMKGGGAGGGKAQIVPMEEINLHFTGDIHAVTSANNLLSAMIDNHIHQGNKLGIKTVIWKRVMDMNDRALRDIRLSSGGVLGKNPASEYETGFEITAASEVMAILCLAAGQEDLMKRLSDIIIGFNHAGEPVYCRDLKAEGSMAVLLKDALDPNLVQTTEGCPAFVHGGPFANIAHGCNSIIATKMALKLADYVITEAGFASDLGAEKFFNIKCRTAGIRPDCVVIVTTIRALLEHGEGSVVKGFGNLEKHVKNIENFQLPYLIALNSFESDTLDDLQAFFELCEKKGYRAESSKGYAEGGSGAIDLARAALREIEIGENEFKHTYELDDSLKTKIEKVAQKVYGASGVIFSETAEQQIAGFEKYRLPICMAKTQYSLSDKQSLGGLCENFKITVRDMALRNGAGFIVVYLGDIMTMPGLSRTPAAENITLEDGKIKGVF